MAWLNDIGREFLAWLLPLLVVGHFLIFWGTMIWVLMSKKDSTSAVAWCLIVILVPFLGPLLFLMFGYQHVHRPLERKRQHMQQYRMSAAEELKAEVQEARHEEEAALGPRVPLPPLSETMRALAERVGAYPLTQGNQVDFFYNGQGAFPAMLADIRAAKHHIHLEFFIFQPDELGKEVLEALTEKARAGVEVRLLYDAMGSHRLSRHLLKPLIEAGGKVSVFLPLNLFRRRFQVNMRNHRKILVVDGLFGFIGGLNIGDEYLGKNAYFGYWRDTHLRIRGPAVAHLQRVFCEDWDFAAEEYLRDSPGAVAGASYFQTLPAEGPYSLQVIDSGPDRDLKSIREVYFAAILKAQKRVWISSPYFIPDAGILDALRLAAHLGVDVRFLGQFQPDKWLAQFAAQYYWGDMLQVGVKVYQYSRGMMHAKVLLIDDDWASVGTANLDNRSLHLNFEVNCMIYSPQAVAELAQAFERDLACSIRLDARVYARRPFTMRLLENACRLLSPVL